MRLTSDAWRIYRFALGLGLRSIFAGRVKDGLKLVIAPVGYWRFCANAFVLQKFGETRPRTVLDVSSPKLTSVMLAALGASVMATDLEDPATLTRWKPTAEAIGLQHYTTEYQDARHLQYPDNSFDFVYSISVIEHIPGNGDVEALREFERVVKPGGTIVVEVPYRHVRDEIFAHVSSRGAPLETPRFYERYYDRESLEERLHAVGTLDVQEKWIFGEWLPIDPWIAADRLPRVLRILILPFEPLMAALNYWVREDEGRGQPLAAMLVYRKRLPSANVAGTPPPQAVAH